MIQKLYSRGVKLPFSESLYLETKHAMKSLKHNSRTINRFYVGVMLRELSHSTNCFRRFPPLSHKPNLLNRIFSTLNALQSNIAACNVSGIRLRLESAPSREPAIYQHELKDLVFKMKRVQNIEDQECRSQISNDFLLFCKKYTLPPSDFTFFFDTAASTYGAFIGQKESCRLSEALLVQFAKQEIYSATLLSRCIAAAGKLHLRGPTSNRVLAEFASKVASCNDRFTSVDLAVAFSIFLRSSANSKESLLLLDALTSATEKAQCTFSANSLAQLLSSLKYCDSDSFEMKRFLRAYDSILQNLSEELSAHHFSMMLCGLQSMSSAPIEVRSLYATLGNKIKESKDNLNAETIANCLVGFSKANPASPQVKLCLTALLPKIAQFQGQFEYCSHMLMALKGIRSQGELDFVSSTLFIMIAYKIMGAQLKLPVSLFPFVVKAAEYLHEKPISIPQVSQLRIHFAKMLLTCEEDEVEVVNFVRTMLLLTGSVAPEWQDAELIAALQRRGLSLISQTDVYSAGSLTQMLTAFVGNSFTDSWTREVLAGLLPSFEKCTEQFSHEQLADIISLFRDMKECHAVSLATLAAINNKLEKSQSRFSPDCIGKQLYAIRNFSSDNPELRRTLRIINSQLQPGVSDMNLKQYCICLSSFKNFRFNHSEVRELLHSINRRFKLTAEDRASESVYILRAIRGISKLDLSDERVQAAWNKLASALESRQQQKKFSVKIANRCKLELGKLASPSFPTIDAMIRSLNSFHQRSR